MNTPMNPELLPRMFAYGRASTLRQQITLSAQEHLCKCHFERENAVEKKYDWGGWYPDAAVSGKHPLFQRPMGEQLFLEARKGDVIIASNFDRFFRSVADADDTLNTFRQKGVGLVFLDVPIPTNTELGHLLLLMIAAVKRMEANITAERTSEGLQEKIRQCQPVGRHAPIGWKKMGERRDSKFAPDDEERDHARWVERLKDENPEIGFRTISRLWKKRQLTPDLPNDERNCVYALSQQYVAAKCCFPLVYRKDLPGITALWTYVKEHDGRPPRLEPGAVREDRLHTLPPMEHRVTIVLGHKHRANHRPYVSS